MEARQFRHRAVLANRGQCHLSPNFAVFLAHSCDKQRNLTKCSQASGKIPFDTQRLRTIPCLMHIAKIPNRNAKPSFLLRESYREDGKAKTPTLADISTL